MSEHSNTDELIKYSLRGDRFAQKSLFEKYSGKMMTLCIRYSSEKLGAKDILQDSFIKVFKNLHKYNGNGSFEGWIRTIIINTALNNRSKLSFSKEVHLEDDYDSSSYEPMIISKLSADEILKIIAELPDGYRIVFNLYVVEGYSHKEIGKLLNIEEATSRSQLAKARKVLQKKILSTKSITI